LIAGATDVRFSGVTSGEKLQTTMNLTKKTILALGVFAAGVSYGQTAADGRPQGLLGARYTEINFGLQDIRHYADHAYGVGAEANNPVIPGVLDAGAAYSYSWVRGAIKGHANTIGAFAKAYAPLNGVKPFVGAGLGYQWTSVRFAGSDEQALWGLSTGVEIPAGAVTVTPRISYADDFEGTRNSSQEWTFAVEANYWFSKTSAVFGSVGKTDVRRSPIDAWSYVVGLRARF
jgi:hypothetical protein